MRNLTTEDLVKIMGEDSLYKGMLIKDLSDDKIIECFRDMFQQAFQHSESRHYTSIMDEPRF